MTSITKLQKSPFYKNDLKEIFEEIDFLFSPSLTERIAERSDVCTFDGYIEKILSKGNLLIAYNKEEIQGFLSFYANDWKTKNAHFTLLGIREKYRGHGLGKRLFIRSIEISKNLGMQRIFSKTWETNVASIALHQKIGFEEYKRENDNVYLVFEL